MKKYIIVISCILCSAAFISRTDNEKIFKQLYALEGKWIMKTKRGAIGEEWHKVDKDHLQSRGFFIKGNDTITTERVALRNSKEGIYYSSTAEGQNNGKAIDFKLTTGSDKTNTFIFENPEHDFPKRIVYEFISADSLHAYIDGGANGQGKREDFYYTKVK